MLATGKAWDVVAYTYEGEVYCPECVAYTDDSVIGEAMTGVKPNQPAPVFASDEIPSDWVCLVCESGVF